VRIECGKQVAVVTGDYNSTHVHQSAEPFETVACDLLITESTFALPIYQWPDEDVVTGEIHAWWKANQAHGRTSILPCYPLGKTQRILASLDASVGPIAVVGPARGFLPFYESAGVNFPPVMNLNDESISELKGKGLVLISFAGKEPPLLQQLQPISFGSASGWMQIRSVRRVREFDRGFILSDHSDWNGLLHSIKASGASRIGVTHGQTDVFSRYLNEVEGLDAFVVPSHFERGSKEEST
jgi:putative mRNA 3-end processing factor